MPLDNLRKSRLRLVIQRHANPMINQFKVVHGRETGFHHARHDLSRVHAWAKPDKHGNMKSFL